MELNITKRAIAELINLLAELVVNYDGTKSSTTTCVKQQLKMLQQQLEAYLYDEVPVQPTSTSASHITIAYCRTKDWQCPILRKTKESLDVYPPYFCPAFNVYRNVTVKGEVLRLEDCGVTKTYLSMREA